MELNFKLGFEQLLFIVKRLPMKQKRKLIAELQSELNRKEKPTDLQKLLLNGPIWKNTEYQAFLKRKEHVDKFTSS